MKVISSQLTYTVYKLIVKFTFSNTYITLTTARGDVIVSTSAGNAGFKGSKRGSSYASEVLFNNLIKVCENNKYDNIILYIDGSGKGRKTVMRMIKSVKLNIISINDITALPHNGCKLPSKRRV